MGTSGARRRATAARMRVLVVEDDPGMLDLLCEAVRRRGHDPEGVADAEAAWAAAQGELFPAVVVDWVLPGMDGLELCRRLRLLPGWVDSALLVVTGRAGPGTLEAVVAAGADDYLPKPFRLADMEARLAMMERLLQERARRDRLRGELARLEERQRLAMDLHDGASQVLFAAVLQLAAAERGGIDPAAALGAARDALERAHAELRGHIDALRATPSPVPSSLGGRMAALVGTLPAVSVRVEPGAEGVLAPAAADHLVRAAQEAAANAVRHADARAVSVRVSRRAGRLLLTVRDDGRGFDPAATRRGLGLANLERRAVALGGTLSIAAGRGRGTVVRLAVPLD